VDFGLSDEQQILQQTVARLLETECPISRVRDLYEGEEPYDPGAWKALVELGVAGLLIPEEHGGAGLGLVDLALVAEILGRAASPVPFLGHALATVAVLEGGSEAQRARWLPRLAGGEARGTVAWAEEGARPGAAGWEPDTWSLRPEPAGARGDGTARGAGAGSGPTPSGADTAARSGAARASTDAGDSSRDAAVAGTRATVSGTKEWVPAAVGADLLVVGAAGGELLLVEGGAPGVSTAPADALDRTRRLDRLVLEGAPCEPLAAGARAARRTRDAGLALLAADAFGGASRLLELSLDYAQTRVQFGVPIASFQAVKHRLADMAVEVEPARALFWYAAHAWDALPDQAERAAALAKAHLGDVFAGVARDAVEIHGGLGFTWECDVQLWFKRALFDRAFLGSPAHHRERAARLAGWSETEEATR